MTLVKCDVNWCIEENKNNKIFLKYYERCKDSFMNRSEVEMALSSLEATKVSNDVSRV